MLMQSPNQQIDPLAITKYDRDRDQIEYFWVYSILVAGKDSDQIAPLVGRLFRNKPAGVTPLAYLESLGHDLHNVLVANRVGQYNRIERAIRDSFGLDLKTATVEELEQVFGVGRKTSRLFVLHSRPDAQVIPLDRHILKWIRHQGVANVPDDTPSSGREYERLERIALALIGVHFPGLTVAQADLLIWAKQSGRLDIAA
jgi:hypothetical protein